MTSSAAIAEVCEVNPRHQKGIDPTDSVAFVGMADLDAETAIATDSHQRPFAEVAKGYTPFMNGDILVAKITPCFENCKIGQAITSTDIAAGSTEFHVLRPGECLDRRYLLHFLRQSWIRELGELRMTGSGGQRRVPERLMEELKIPLPSIEEQRRIAAVMDAADELRTKRRQAIAKLDTLTQAIFIDMFGDLAEDLVPIGELAEVQGGLQVSKKRSVNPIEVPYLRVANVHRGRLDLGEIKSMRVTQKELDRTRLEKGDLLVVEGHGNADEIGRVAEWNGQISGCTHQNHLIRVRTGEQLRPPFAEAYLNSPIGRRQLLSAANTTSGLNTITTRDVRQSKVIVAPLDRQDEFVERRSVVDEQQGLSSLSIKELDTLFASLEQRAFAGEL